MYNILEKELGSFVGDYRKKWKETEDQKKVFDYPLHLNFEIVFGCNLRCPFCTQSVKAKNWSYNVEPKKVITFEKFCEIIDEGVENDLHSIELNGINEPLLQKDLCRYISYAKEKGEIVISLHSNSLLLNEKNSNELIDSGLTSIVFSVDGSTKETYEKIRVGGKFEKMLECINLFLDIKKKRQSKFPLVRMSFAENKLNYEEYEEYKNYWENRVDFVSKSHFSNPFLRDEQGEELEEEYRLTNYLLEDCFESYQRLFIHNNGDVSPCCSFFGGEIKIGNVYDTSIYNLWNSDKLKKMRIAINAEPSKQPKACVKCRESLDRRLFNPKVKTP